MKWQPKTRKSHQQSRWDHSLWYWKGKKQRRREVCFTCRKCWAPQLVKIHPESMSGPSGAYVSCCPQCGGKVYQMNTYFRAPSRTSRRGIREWQVLQARYEHVEPEPVVERKSIDRRRAYGAQRNRQQEE